jgi:hypothetical protein
MTPPQVVLITGCTRGVLAGQRRALRTVLAARFGPLAPATHDRIAACDHLVQLDAWLRAAATAPTLTAVWRDAPEGITQGITPGITPGITQGITQGITPGITQGPSAPETEPMPAERAA